MFTTERITRLGILPLRRLSLGIPQLVPVVLGLVAADICHAQINIVGPAIVTGDASTRSLNATDALNSNSHSFTVGKHGASFGGSLLYHALLSKTDFRNGAALAKDDDCG